MATKRKKKVLPPAQAQRMFDDFKQRLAEIEAHIARIKDMILRDQIKFCWVPKVTVKEHKRAGHWRPYYPTRRREKPSG